MCFYLLCGWWALPLVPRLLLLMTLLIVSFPALEVTAATASSSCSGAQPTPLTVGGLSGLAAYSDFPPDADVLGSPPAFRAPDAPAKDDGVVFDAEELLLLLVFSDLDMLLI